MMDMRTQERLMGQSLEASRRMWRSFMVATIPVIFGVLTWNTYTSPPVTWTIIVIGSMMFAGGCTMLIISAMDKSRIDTLLFEFEDNDDDEPDDASDMLNFTSEQTPAPARLESVEGNTMRLGRYAPDKGTWAQLGETLKKNRWKWSRPVLHQANVYKNLTSRFPEITAEMIELRFVDGPERDRWLTTLGKKWFIDESPNLFLEDM